MSRFRVEVQSDVINMMRFPLIILVLFIHMLPATEYAVFSTKNFSYYLFVSELISHNIGRVAVPCFFLFSGYYYFYHLTEWNANFYISQQKKRLLTLIVPYFIWNAIAFLCFTSKNFILLKFGINSEEALQYSFYQIFWDIPIDYPLWYLRDLICMTILAPMFYYLFSRTHLFGMLFLLAIYLTTYELQIPGLSSTAFVFFGAGAYFGMKKIDILKLSSQFKNSSIILSVLFLLISIYLNGESLHEYTVRIFVIFGIISIMNIIAYIQIDSKMGKIFKALPPTVFFIYAVHEIYIIHWLKGGFYRTFLFESEWGKLLIYFLVPFICVGICLALYFILKKILPRVLSISIGGRVLKGQ